MRASVGSATFGLVATPAALAYPCDTHQLRSTEDGNRIAHLSDDEPKTGEHSKSAIRMVIKALIGALVFGVLVLGFAPASLACDNGGCSRAAAPPDDPNNPKTSTRLSEMESGS